LQQFFSLLVGYLRGESNIIRILKSKEPLSHPIPLCCLPRIELGKKFFQLCKVMILQFVLAKPFFALLSVVLSLIPAGDGADNMYGDGEWRVDRGYLWITGFDNFSVTLAMYFLVLFYLATQEELARYHPVPKFLCIKMVLFVAFWQSCLGRLTGGPISWCVVCVPLPAVMRCCGRLPSTPLSCVSSDTSVHCVACCVWVCVGGCFLVFFLKRPLCNTVSGLEWFGLIHDIGDWTAINIEYFLEDFLITVEMFLIALAHAYAFGHQGRCHRSTHVHISPQCLRTALTSHSPTHSQ
jgi:Organic solute transporter Ostalpha